MAIEKIMYSDSELCTALGIRQRDIDILEQLPDPLPSFYVDGVGRLYPRHAIELWAARQCAQKSK